MRLARRALLVVLLAAATTMIAVGRPAPPGLDTRPARLDPARFTTRIDNPFWPMAPGSRWVYRETDADGEARRRVEVTVLRWQAGVGGTQPAIVVPADPDPGMVYRPQWAAATTQVLSAGMRASVPYGSFDHLVITKESSAPQEPRRVEHEFYARGVGPVLAITVSGGSGREELVRFDDGRTGDTAPG
jgi:hypothetical protein